MSIIRQIARNTTVQLAGKGVSTILGIVAVMVMTRSLGVEKFGWYVTAAGFLQFIGILSDFGFAVTSANMLSEPHFDRKHLLNTLFTWRFLTSLLFYGLFPVAILFFSYPLPIKLAVAIIAISFFATSLNQIFIAYYQVKLKMHIYMAGEIIGRAVLAGGIILVAKSYWGFLPMMAVIALAGVINTAVLWIKSEGIQFSIHKDISRALWRKIWPVALSVIFNSFYLQGDRVILPLYAPQTDVGLYGAAYRIIEILIQISAMIMGLMLPLVSYSWARNETANFKQRSQWSFDIVMLSILPMVAGLLALAEPIMLFVAGKDFAGGGHILSILALLMIGICPGMIYGHINLAIGRQKEAMWVYLSDAVFSMIGYLIFIPRHGMLGAAYVAIFSQFYAGIFLSILAIHYSKYFPRIKNMLKILAASAAMGFFVYALQPIKLIWSILIGASLYAVLILILNIVSKKTIMEILRPSKNEIAILP